MKEYKPIIFTQKDISYPPRIRDGGNIVHFDLMVRELIKISDDFGHYTNLTGHCTYHNKHNFRLTHRHYCDLCLEMIRVLGKGPHPRFNALCN